MIYIVFLRFASNRALARQWMGEHNAWIQRGIRDGVFLLTGSLTEGQGGAVLACNIGLDELRERVAADPFVAHQVVAAEIVPIAPSAATT
jgi:uncharacterized protein YciI